MRFTRGYRSDDVEDRRGRGGRLRLGVGGTIVGIILYLALGQDILGVTSGGGGTSSTDRQKRDSAQIEEALDLMQAFWAERFARQGRRYVKAKLVLFWDRVDTGGCGGQGAAVGPFYCPADHKAYIDLAFFDVLKERLGAGGDFAQVYVLAHELGHHVQNIAPTPTNRQFSKNDRSVRQELQADCYAGVWAADAQRQGRLEAGDVGEAMNAARSIGDDRLQEMAGQRVNSDSWTHGSSAQRKRWFSKGFEEGTMAACDTFAATRL